MVPRLLNLFYSFFGWFARPTGSTIAFSCALVDFCWILQPGPCSEVPAGAKTNTRAIMTMSLQNSSANKFLNQTAHEYFQLGFGYWTWEIVGQRSHALPRRNFD